MDHKTIEGIVLIGMPCVGKSTIGALLSEQLELNFVDTDQRLELFLGSNLQKVIDRKGYLYLREAEEQVLLKESSQGKVIATGGSAVYSENGMSYLKSNALVIFLDLPRENLEERITNFSTRGIARRPDQSFASLFDERRALYLRHTDLRVNCLGLSIDQLLNQLTQISIKHLRK
jgi:shikimate kinase